MEKGQEGTPYRMEKTMLKVGFTTDKEKDSQYGEWDQQQTMQRLKKKEI